MPIEVCLTPAINTSLKPTCREQCMFANYIFCFLINHCVTFSSQILRIYARCTHQEIYLFPQNGFLGPDYFRKHPRPEITVDSINAFRHVIFVYYAFVHSKFNFNQLKINGCMSQLQQWTNECHADALCHPRCHQ